jgi:hypothetical protein
MELVAKGAVSDAYEALGVNEQDFRLVCGREPWIAMERQRVVSVLDTLTHGVVDIMGLPRIEVPAEFRAAVLVIFVDGGNLAVACRWSESGAAAEELAEGGSLEPVTARELFALCCQIHGDAEQARGKWEKRMGRAIRDVEVKE